MYKYFKSSKRKYSQDCVVRSIMVATGWDWEQVFNAIVPICLKLKDVPNSDVVYKKFFSNMKWEACKVEKEEDLSGTRSLPTVEEFARDHKKGTYILTVSGHMVCVKEGDWYDTWDCRYYKVRKYWIVNKDVDWSIYDGLFNKTKKKS